MKLFILLGEFLEQLAKTGFFLRLYLKSPFCSSRRNIFFVFATESFSYFLSLAVLDPIKYTFTMQQIIKLCKEYPEIIAAYLLGSEAQGTSSAASDLDLALLVRHEMVNDFDLFGFMVKLEKLLERKADVVLLNRAGEVLKYQVRLHGKLLYEADSALRKFFEVMSRKYYEDFLYLHKNYTKKVLYGEKNG